MLHAHCTAGVAVVWPPLRCDVNARAEESRMTVLHDFDTVGCPSTASCVAPTVSAPFPSQRRRLSLPTTEL